MDYVKALGIMLVCGMIARGLSVYVLALLR